MIHTLTGENQYLLAQALQKRIHDFIDVHGEHALERIDGADSDLRAVQDSLGSLPFLTDKKCLVLYQPSKIAGFTDRHEALLDNPSEALDVIIIEPQLDKRTTYAKYLKKQTDMSEFASIDPYSAPSWVQDEASARGAKITRSDAQYLVSRVGIDQYRLHNELDKLISYNSTITRQTIDLLSDATPQSSIFDLLDAALSGEAEKALQLYDDQRAQKIEPQQILAMLARQLHILSIVSYAPQGGTSQSIARDAQVHPYAIEKIQKIARVIGRDRVPVLIEALRDIDRAQKTKPLDVDQAIRYFIVSLGPRS